MYVCMKLKNTYITYNITITFHIMDCVCCGCKCTVSFTQVTTKKGKPLRIACKRYQYFLQLILPHVFVLLFCFRALHARLQSSKLPYNLLLAPDVSYM